MNEYMMQGMYGGMAGRSDRAVYLRCIHEYLYERGVIQATLHSTHIYVPRRRRTLNVAFTGQTIVTVEVSEGEKVVDDRDFDICSPKSLQAIFEYVMSKRNK